MSRFFDPYDRAAERAKGKWRSGAKFDCGICRQRLPDERRVYDGDCPHSCVCYECYQKRIDLTLSEGRIPTCPYLCPHELRLSLITHVYEEAKKELDTEKLVSDLTEKSLLRLIDCPNCHIASEGDFSCEIAECVYCDATFCTLCFELVDDGHDCSMRKWIAEEQKKSGYYADEGEEVDSDGEPIDGDRERYFDDDEEEDEYYQTHTVTRCPSCGCLSQKVNGCSYVTCPITSCRYSYQISRAAKAI